MKKGYIKTLIILVGIVLAILMTIKGPYFSSEAINLKISDNNNVTQMTSSNEVKKEKSTGGTSSTRYNSGARLLHVFTKNLPYLNNK